MSAGQLYALQVQKRSAENVYLGSVDKLLDTFSDMQCEYTKNLDYALPETAEEKKSMLHV